MLLQRYALQDVAFKVVGVGSVGTFCAIGLLVSGSGAPLLLQIKEAQQSVLAPFAGASDYSNQGQRVVVGQRMLQAATDVFLGWTQTPIERRHFYIRRLKDFAARRYRRATRGGATILRGALWTHIGAGACTRWRCGCHRWVHGKWHRVRCGDWRVCTRLCRPDRTRLERISGRNQGRTNCGPGAVDAEKREHAPEEPEVSAFATLSRHSSSQQTSNGQTMASPARRVAGAFRQKDGTEPEILRRRSFVAASGTSS